MVERRSWYGILVASASHDLEEQLAGTARVRARRSCVV
jgi:hypothetical protein